MNISNLIEKIPRFILLLLILFFLSENKLLADKKRFLLISHLYPIINNTEILDKIIKKINSENIDSVFILGDSSIHEKKNYIKLTSEIKYPIFFTPGNEEIKSKLDYIKNVGYFNKEIIFENYKIILVNSSDSIDEIRKFLNLSLKTNKKPHNFIFTHFRIWDDALISKKPEEHNKSYLYKELREDIKYNVDAVFSGDSKRYYFSDLKQQDSYGKQNINLVFWVDQIDNINFYSIGNGDAFPNINYTILEIGNIPDEYRVLPKKIEIQKDITENINGRFYNLIYQEPKTFLERIINLFYNKKFYAGFFFAIFIIIVIFLFKFKKK